MPSDFDTEQKLREQADALDRIIREAKEVKAVVETCLREIRQAARPSPAIERRKPPRKIR